MEIQAPRATLSEDLEKAPGDAPSRRHTALHLADDGCCFGVAARQIVRYLELQQRTPPYQSNVRTEVRFGRVLASRPIGGGANCAAVLSRQPGCALDLAGHQGRRRHDTARRPQ